MKQKIITLKHCHTEANTETFLYQTPTAADYDHVLSEYCTVLKPNGELLLKLVPRSLKFAYVEAAYHAFSDKLYSTDGTSRAAMKDSPNPGSEGVIGFMDSSYPFTFCRETSLTAKHLEEFAQTQPFIRSAGLLMEANVPDRYAAQLAACQSCNSEYLIPFTPFSSVTLNRDVTAKYHTDKGDYKPGIGIISATWAKMNAGWWTVVQENPAAGGLLVFPRYRVAVHLRSTDTLFCDVHEVHGVTPIIGTPGSWARLSSVFYLREKLNLCPTAAEQAALVDSKDYAKYLARTPRLKAADDDEEGEVSAA